MRIRQIALVAAELDPVVEDLCTVLGLEVCFHDPGVAQFGLKNALMAVGDTFLEVVCPVEESTTAGRFLERRGGDSGYMVIVQTEDLAEDRRRLEALGVRVVFDVALDDIATIHLHPRDVGGAILSLDQPEPAWSWRWAGPDWEKKMRSDRSRRIVGATLEAEDPETLAGRWSEVLARPLRWDGDTTRTLAFDEGGLAFETSAAGRGAGVSAVRIEVADDEAAKSCRASAEERGLFRKGQIIIGGTRFELVRSGSQPG